MRGEYGGAAASFELSSLIKVEDARPELPEPLAILVGEYRLRRVVDFFAFFFVREETSFSSEWVDARKKFTTRCGILPTWSPLPMAGKLWAEKMGWTCDRLTTPQPYSLM